MKYFNSSQQKPVAEGPTLPSPPELPTVEKPQPAQSAVVTSLQKCFDAIGREETLDIKRNYIKPYEECEKRLKKKQEEELKNKKALEKDSQIPETPRNYIRVQKDKSQ